MPKQQRYAFRDRGFSMLEIVAAIVVLGVVMAAAAPQMVSSIRASSKAKLVSRAKGILQGQLDAMRTMPFRVAPAAGDHRDLLDTYYRNRTAGSTPACGTAAKPAKPLATWTGYVSAASSARCSYEPAGAMYRKVIPGGTGDIPANFAVVVNTQFISAATTPTVLDVASTFDSQVTGRDRPPSWQVGVTATVLYNAYGSWTPTTVYTQITSRTANDIRIRLEARGTAVEMGTETGGEAMSLTGGQIDLSGSLANTSQARANVTAMTGATATGGRQNGAAASVAAPYTNLITVNTGAGGLGSGCSDTCWGATALPPFTVQADYGLPRAGVGALTGLLGPVQTSLPDIVTRNGFEFDVNDVDLPGGLEDELVSMDPVPPAGDLVANQASGLFHCAFSLVGPASHLTGAGYLNSTDETSPVTPLSVEACGGARSNVIRLLPTTRAPDGLIRVSVKSSARCTVSGAAHVPSTSYDYRAEIEYFKWTPGYLNPLTLSWVPGSGQYVSAGVVTPATAVDPLASINLATKVSDSETLDDYIASWSALTADQVVRTAANRVAEVQIPALFTLQTEPIATDVDTALSFAAGSASCRAEDNR
jgi:prepilin-type N-terminal cleavage/methylation domain-containing protein